MLIIQLPIHFQTVNLEVIIQSKPIVYGGRSGRLPLSGISLIKKFEGCYLRAYPDPLSGGIPITIGWGSTQKEDHSPWHLGDEISQAAADRLLIIQLEKDYLPSLERIPNWRSLTPNQQGALLSFAYNLGADFYHRPGFSRISKAINDRNWRQIEMIFELYRNPGTSVEKGLRRRRLNEAWVFLH
jgi:lysozyme